MSLATQLAIIGSISGGHTPPTAPTNIIINNSNILDNAAANTVVGALTMVGGILPATFSVISPNTFTISGSNLIRSNTGTITPGTVSVVVSCTDATAQVVSVTIPVSVLDHTVTMAAVLTLHDGSVATFTTAHGTELDTYTNPYDGTVTRTIADYSNGLPYMRVMFRIDGAGARYSIRFDWGEAIGTYGNPAVLHLPPYTAEIYVNGVLTDTVTAPDPTGNSSHHWWGASWTWESSAIPIVKTGAQVKATGYAWDFDSTQPQLRPVSGASLPYKIMNYSSVTSYMPTTGGRDDIGMVPAGYACWVATENSTMSNTVTYWSKASLSFPWNWWDRSTSAPINMSTTYPHATFDGRQYLSSVNPNFSVSAPLLGYYDFDNITALTSIIAQQSVTISTPLNINGALASGGVCVLATLPEAFSIQIVTTGADFSATVFHVVGTDINGASQSEDINGANDTRRILIKRYRSITSVTPTVSLPAGGLVCMGIFSYMGTMQAAHCPNLSYIPFLRTGNVEHLEQLQFSANWLYASDPSSRVVSQNETRGAAWSLNHIFCAAKALQLLSSVPNYLLPVSYWSAIIANNATDLMNNYVNNPSSKTANYFSGTAGNMSFWQEGFLLGVFITAVEWGWSGSWITIRDWKIGAVTNRYTVASQFSGWPRSRSLTASGYADDNSWLGLTTWTQLAAAQASPIVATVSGNLATDLDSEYLSVDRGNLARMANHGNSAAIACITWFEPQMEATYPASIMWQWSFKY